MIATNDEQQPRETTVHADMVCQHCGTRETAIADTIDALDDLVHEFEENRHADCSKPKPTEISKAIRKNSDPRKDRFKTPVTALLDVGRPHWADPIYDNGSNKASWCKWESAEIRVAATLVEGKLRDEGEGIDCAEYQMRLLQMRMMGEPIVVLEADRYDIDAAKWRYGEKVMQFTPAEATRVAHALLALVAIAGHEDGRDAEFAERWNLSD